MDGSDTGEGDGGGGVWGRRFGREVVELGCAMAAMVTFMRRTLMQMERPRMMLLNVRHVY